MTPVVTVLMAVHDGERFLREAIDSILRQTFSDLEFLIVDDGSRDGTAAILRSYADPRIRIVRNERNIGLAASLNRGLELARGWFIARQDADDVSEPQRLATQVSHFAAHADLGLLGSSYLEIDDRGNALEEQRLPCRDVDLRWALLFYCPFVHSATMFPRVRVLETAGLYDERLAYAPDHDYWLRIARHSPVANVDEVLVRYRIHPGSMTETRAATREATEIPAAAVAELLGRDDEPPQLREERFEELFAYLYGSLDELTPRRAAAVARRVRTLHRAFARADGLDPRAERAHLVAESVRIGERCLRSAARRLAQGDRRGARALIRQGVAWHWPLLVRSDVAATLLRSLAPVRSTRTA